MEQLRQGLSRLPITARIALSVILVLALTAALAVVDWFQVGAIEGNVRAADANIEAYDTLRDLQIQALKVNLAIQKFVNTEGQDPLEAVRREVQSLATAVSAIGNNGRLDTTMDAPSRNALEQAIEALHEALNAVVDATDARRTASDQTLVAGAAAYGATAGMFDSSLAAGDLELTDLAGRALFGVLDSRFLLARSEGPAHDNHAFPQSWQYSQAALDAFPQHSGRARVDQSREAAALALPAFGHAAQELFRRTRVLDNANLSVTRLSAAVNDLVVEATAALGQNRVTSMRRAIDVIDSVQRFTIILGFGIVGFGALGAWLIADSVARPMVRLTEVTRRIANGDLSTEIPAAAYRDEIGAMASALIKFRDDGVAIRRLERERIEGEAKARLAEAVDAMNHGFGLYDDDDRMVLCNQLHRRWSTDFAYPNAGTGAREIELADGTWIRLDEARTPSGYTVRVQTDVSALKQHARELTTAKEAAEAANRVKSEFLANMSHELRTPLNAVIGFSEALSMGVVGAVTSKQLEYVRDIHASGSHLLEIVNDILDLSKIAAGRLEIAPRPIDLLRVIAASVALVQGRADEAELRIKVDVPADIPLLKADELRLKQILLNLLSNAVKFTPRAGEITISARVVDTSLRLSVRDTGIGMRPQDVATALEPFGQVDSKLHRRYAGTGLGLPLVKALVELHGGELHIESAPERGTCVTARFADYLTRAREAAAA